MPKTEKPTFASHDSRPKSIMAFTLFAGEVKFFSDAGGPQRKADADTVCRPAISIGLLRM